MSHDVDETTNAPVEPAAHRARVAERRAALEKAARELAELRAVQASSLSHDLEIAQRIRTLGFDAETAKVFDLVPLIHVAWADGAVQPSERNAIYEIMRARGLDEAHAGWVMVDSLLESAPSDALVTELVAVFQDLVRGDNRRIEVLVDLCVVVAEQHGKILGLFGDPIDPKERRALNQIAELLGDRAKVWLNAKISSA